MVRILSYKTSYFSSQQDQNEPSGIEFGGDSNEPVDESFTNSSFTADEGSMQRNLLNITSLDYLHIWSNLLDLNEFKELNLIGVHVNERQRLVKTIYDELVECFIKILKKLDLNAVRIEQNEEAVEQAEVISVSSNPIAGLKPSRPKDFEILINLVDFAKLVIYNILKKKLSY